MSSIKRSFCASEVVKLLLMLALFFCQDLIQVNCLLPINYPIFNTEDRKAFHFSNDTDIYLNAIQVTRDVRGADISNFSGRVVFRKKFKLWSKKKNTTATFNSTFVLNITPETTPGGEGLTFLLTKDSSLPANSHGQWLGLVNSSTNGSSLTNTVAVEFDTKKSYSEDLAGDHVGVDLNSINSIQQVPLAGYGVNLSSGTSVTATILYDGVKLSIFAFMTDNGTEENRRNPIISMNLTLSDYLPEDVYIGFSASTGESTQLNCIKSWYFTSTDIHDDSANLLWLWILIGVISCILTCGSAYYTCWKSDREKVQGLEQEPEEEKYPGIEQELQISTTSPQKYQLKDLVYATDNFHPKNKLGEGGFGAVYKGKLYNKEVAVKRISKDSRQGKQEFLAEVKTISGLHHKNLVKLMGWCYESNELLIVYEFMPNGSLDKLIFSGGNATSSEIPSTLSWEKRHSIIYGVGQALDYLHSGCEKRVLHRDIKASNIMLDSEYNARLGDFGLARTFQLSERTHHSTKEIAGTPGYIAPEFFHTGRASAEIDVYAFGILLLEVACGKKPGDMNVQNHYINGIVEWVWEHYRRERITDAIDERLNGEYQSDQAECVLLLGLACCHPNPYERPSMRTVCQVLTGEADPPDLPIDKPAFMWPAMTPPSFSLNDSSLSGGETTPFSALSGR